MFYYYLYERKFISDIQLFNIPQSNIVFESVDISIHKGAVDINDIPENIGNVYLSKDFAIVNFRYGIMRINTGSEIVYSIKDNYKPESVTPFIIGWGLTIVLTQSGHSAFHCSALTRNNQCFFVSGISGAGKSTTSLELLKHGCKYLCDDMAIVDNYDNMMISPAFPIQKVCPDITSDLNNDNLYAINNDKGKYSYLNPHDYCDTAKPLTIIFKLLLGNEDNVIVKEITGIEKYFKVLECLFLGIRYSQSSFPEDEKFRCLKIAGNVRLFTITRPFEKDTLNDVTNCILRILDEQGV